jgi:hypothetical protein
MASWGLIVKRGGSLWIFEVKMGVVGNRAIGRIGNRRSDTIKWFFRSRAA